MLVLPTHLAWREDSVISEGIHSDTTTPFSSFEEYHQGPRLIKFYEENVTVPDFFQST